MTLWKSWLGNWFCTSRFEGLKLFESASGLASWTGTMVRTALAGAGRRAGC